jgi:hypothetical protein
VPVAIMRMSPNRRGTFSFSIYLSPILK